MKRIDPKKLKAIAELIERGETNKAIAAQVGCSASTVTKVRKELAAGVVAASEDAAVAAFTGGGDDGPVDGWEETPATAPADDDDGMSLVPTDYLRALEVVVSLVEENQRLRREVANG